MGFYTVFYSPSIVGIPEPNEEYETLEEAKESIPDHMQTLEAAAKLHGHDIDMSKVIWTILAYSRDQDVIDVLVRDPETGELH